LPKELVPAKAGDMTVSDIIAWPDLHLLHASDYDDTAVSQNWN
jgi:hypothetical protein